MKYLPTQKSVKRRGSERRPPRSTSFLRNRWGLNWSASSPQTEASICTRCKGTTNIDRAGTVIPEPSFKSGLKENEIQSESEWKTCGNQNWPTGDLWASLVARCTDQSVSNLKTWWSRHKKKRIGKGIQKVYNMRTMFQRTSLQKRSSRQKASRFTYSSK